MTEFSHRAGAPLECICMALKVHKCQEGVDAQHNPRWSIGMRIGGGIDQDHRQSVYSDAGIYVTGVEPNSPAEVAGLKVHDKILQVNGVDYTMITHERAVKYLKKEPVLDVLVTRAKPKQGTTEV
uniref:PDZ domain-containing protein n=1 Tax=Globodera rostochiensis TaxID=31243 RepID=A0A914HVG7_GLORO